MEIRRWKVVDIYYKAGEEEIAARRADVLEAQGYDREDSDGFDEFVGAIQLKSPVKIDES